MQVNAVSNLASGSVRLKNEGVNKTNNTFVNPVQSDFLSKSAAQVSKLNALNLSKTIAFTSALYGSFQDLNTAMVTCKTENKDGEKVGSRANLNKLLFNFQDDFSKYDDALKTTMDLGDCLARTQVKMGQESEIPDVHDFKFEMISRKKPSADAKVTSRKDPFYQRIAVTLSPVNYLGMGTPEQAYVLNTKNNLMAVVEDGDSVLLTNAGKITKKDASDGTLCVEASQANNKFRPFVPTRPIESVQYEPTESVGEGAEIVIGMEDGRFVNEIKDSIRTFVQKINNGEIVLKPFVAQPDAKDTQLIMLAGGFGSRAEYTNASCSAIFHDETDGAQSTKGVFRTPTGLTPMETTFVTLHNAGLLDCSKGVLSCDGEHPNIKFYLNQSGVNKGNGGYTVDLYNAMKNSNRKQVMVFPNDSMSRLTNAVIEANRLMESGQAAIAIIAKEIPAEECVKTFGIMKLDENNEILDFAEKPETIGDDWKRDGNCLTNTFQFAVSDEAFEVLKMFEPYFSKNDKSKETRDWSKQYIPIIKTLSQNDDIEKIKDDLAPVLNVSRDELDKKDCQIDSTIIKAKEVLGDKKLMAVPTSESWADCGTLNALYHTVMQIVSGDFELEPFERANAAQCVNTQTGLVATSPEIKQEIEDKYNIEGQVMVVPQAKKVYPEDVDYIPTICRLPNNYVVNSSAISR